jgi:hypothetical protein
MENILIKDIRGVYTDIAVAPFFQIEAVALFKYYLRCNCPSEENVELNCLKCTEYADDAIVHFPKTKKARNDIVKDFWANETITQDEFCISLYIYYNLDDVEEDFSFDADEEMKFAIEALEQATLGTPFSHYFTVTHIKQLEKNGGEHCPHIHSLLRVNCSGFRNAEDYKESLWKLFLNLETAWGESCGVFIRKDN